MPSPQAVGSIITNNIQRNKFYKKQSSPNSTNMRVNKNMLSSKDRFKRGNSKREGRSGESSPYSPNLLKKTVTQKEGSSKKSINKHNFSQTQVFNLSSKINQRINDDGQQYISFDSASKSMNIDYDLTAQSQSQIFTQKRQSERDEEKNSRNKPTRLDLNIDISFTKLNEN